MAKKHKNKKKMNNIFCLNKYYIPFLWNSATIMAPREYYFYRFVDPDLPIDKRLLDNLDHAKWIFVISYEFYDADGKKMLEIYNKIFERNIY